MNGPIFGPFPFGNSPALDMRLIKRDNAAEVEKDFDDIGAELGIAAPRAANRLLDQAQVAGFRVIAEQYGVGPRTIEKYARIKPATLSDLRASLTVKGSGFPLYVMEPRQTRKGVSVRVKGRRFVIAGTFLATMPSGHVGVFARGAYGGKSATALHDTHSFGRFVFGKGRRVRKPGKRGTSELPVNELFTFGPAEAFSNPDVVEAMNDRIDQQFAAVIKAELRFARRA